MDLSVSSVAPFLKCSRSARLAATAGSAAPGAMPALSENATPRLCISSACSSRGWSCLAAATTAAAAASTPRFPPVTPPSAAFSLPSRSCSTTRAWSAISACSASRCASQCARMALACARRLRSARSCSSSARSSSAEHEGRFSARSRACRSSLGTAKHVPAQCSANRPKCSSIRSCAARYITSSPRFSAASVSSSCGSS